MNGFSTEEDNRASGHNQICCLIDGAFRCSRQAGNASYSKRIQKTVLQRRLRLTRDDSVGGVIVIIIIIMKHQLFRVTGQDNIQNNSYYIASLRNILLFSFQ